MLEPPRPSLTHGGRSAAYPAVRARSARQPALDGASPDVSEGVVRRSPVVTGPDASLRVEIADRRTVHLAQGIADELEPRAVGIAKVDRRSVDVRVVDARFVELGLEMDPSRWLDRDRQVVQTTKDLRVGTEIEAGEIEERDGVAVADVEEEMRRPLVVTILEHV